MAKTKKQTIPGYDDEYFINLVMDIDERDDNIYPLWARFCALSEDKYYIDGRNHAFFTHVRTDEEIDIERKKREIREFSISQREYLFRDGDDRDSEKNRLFDGYRRYLDELTMTDDPSILNVQPKTYDDWKKEHE